jgi:hypothetical protein
LDPVLVPTQVRHPWRATARTIFAATVAFAAMWGTVVDALDLDPSWGWVAVATAVTGGITRLMAIPAVDQFLGHFLPFLAAEGDESVQPPIPPR